MATVQTKPAPRTEARAGQRRIRVTIKKVNPWSVLKVSLIFYFCMMLVMLGGLGILYGLLNALGILTPLADFLAGLFSEPSYAINGFAIFRTFFMIGFITVVVGSAFTMFLAFLYNLLSDLVGGIEVTLVERR
jgi:hypothetical protein